MKTFHSFLSIVVIIIIALSSSCNSTSINKEKEEDQLLRVQIGEKYGFINQDGKIVIEPQFDETFLYFSDDVCFARIGERKGLIDKNGQFILELPDSVQMVYNFIDGVAKVRFGEYKYNMINSNGDYILKNNHYNVTVNKDGEATYLCIEGMNDFADWYMADINGEIIGEPCDSILTGFSEGLCAVKFRGKWGYINNKGELEIDTIYQTARIFTKDNIARVKKDSLEYFIGKNGKNLFGFDKTLSGFQCNRAFVLDKEKKYIIDKEGNKISEINADIIYPYSSKDSLATIIKNNLASKINTEGKVILSTKYENIGTFVNGIARVSKNGKYGYIDENGNEVVKVAYDDFLSTFETENSKVRALALRRTNSWEIAYFDLKGNLIGKDMPTNKAMIPRNPSKEDFKAYFDDRLSELDPIEGIYYVTIEDYYQDRDNPNKIGLNDSRSKFYAIVRNEDKNEFHAIVVDETDRLWRNKFVKIGDSNNYAIVTNEDVSQDKEKYSSEGKMTLEDPFKFEFRLEQGHNNWYNWFASYEFVKDYPQVEEYEKIQKAEWTGSGFAISDGYIATNYHVTSGAKNIRIKGINGDFKKSYKAIVVANDKDNDISILKIVDKNYNGMGSIPYKIGKTMVDVGENIFILGYPKVDTMGEEIKVTEGVISSSSGFQGNSSMYQISAAVQPGNSGGPLFDDEGTVIGIVCAKHADAENANYAVKISNLFSLINSSNLGITVADNNVNEKKVSSIVKKVKNYVYLIECNSR